jgi:hypothetical protein
MAIVRQHGLADRPIERIPGDRGRLWVNREMGGASCRFIHVRKTPLATVGPKKAACR